MVMGYLDELNEKQKEAVTSIEQYVRVIAGAGSGKTRVLTHRIAYLINDIGIPDNTILAITFTNKAAKEMKDRVNKLLNNENCRATISTFHSFCARLLREDIRVLDYPRSFVIIDEDDQEKIVTDIMESLNISKEFFSLKSLISFISNNKSDGISPKKSLEYSNGFKGEETKSQVYEKYEEFLKDNYYLDFDDLILKTNLILQDYENIRLKWQRRITNILVDEFQDTNIVQYKLIKLLCSEQTNLFVVGDPDQTIYTWRGADVNIIMNFKKDHPNTKDVVLDKNYRSTKSILDGANSLISYNKKREPKNLYTENPKGGDIIYYQGDSVEHEAWWVIERIKELRYKNSNCDYGDFAIMYRSYYYSRAFETALIKAGIPYAIYGGKKFFERKEVKDAMCYLRLVARSDDDLAFERVINTPRRGIGEKTMLQIKSGASQEKKSLYDYLKDSSLSARNSVSIMTFFDAIELAKTEVSEKNIPFAKILENLLEKVGYLKVLKDDKETERIENIKEFGDYLFEFQSNNGDIDLVDILQEIALYTNQDEIKTGARVSLMTIHTAKGLEFPYVFLVGMSEGVFPNQRSIVENPASLEEERRLAYVAYTRAMKQLFLTDSIGYNFSSQSYRVSSRFLKESGDFIKPYYNNSRYKESLKKPTVPKREFETLEKNSINWHPGDMLMHTVFGEGIIIAMTQETLTVAFKDAKYGQKIIAKTFGGIFRRD
ncbi:MAG: UvrD-helicase domain-containing protein [Bacilli bacterium]|nr:UvrD-helicase domain-containing protein [Bacilli bacterium]